jgi:6-phosphogluconolactonase (cycloisomerase 2 family)
MGVRFGSVLAPRVAVFVLAMVAPAAAPAAASVWWTYTGCVVAASSTASACAPGGPIARVVGETVSPDGSLLGVAGSRSSGVALFGRDAASGALRWLGCASDNATDGRDGTDGACADADALQGPTAVVSDGARIYVGATRSSAVDVLEGVGLAPFQCLRASAADSRCGEERALAGARSLALAPGGAQLYVAAAAANAIVVLQRDLVSGALAPAGCVSANGQDGHCADGAALLAPTGIAVSSDGRFLYVVAAGSSAIASFARDAASGALRQTGCVMARVPAAGSCLHARSLGGAYALALSGDGRDLYVAGRSAGAVTTLEADPVTGTLRVVGCRGPRTRAMRCVSDGMLRGVRSIALTPDGRAAVAATASGIELFSRDAASGTLRRAACVRPRPRPTTRCRTIAAVAGARSLVVSPDSRDVYVGTDTGVAAFRLGGTK